MPYILRFSAIPAWAMFVFLVTATSIPAAAMEVPVLTDAQLVELTERAAGPNLRPPGVAIAITGDEEIDDAIRAMAESRGYRRRPTPAGPLQAVDGQYLQPAAALAWESLKRAAAQAGFSLQLVSGYRSEAAQVRTFLSGAGGSSLAAFEARLAWSAPPGYSKHHTGYVIDLALPGQSHNDFGGTAAHRWLVADNYSVAKSFGFVPSYPSDGPPQGPNPEAWEFTYVGGWAFRCWRQLLFGAVSVKLGGPPSCPE